MNAKDVIMFFIALQAAGLIAAALAANDVIMLNPSNMPYDTTNITTEFSLGIFIAVSSAVGGITGLIALITRQGTYANYVTLIWIVGIFGGVATWVLTGFTNMFDVLLPAEMNPNGLFSGIIYAFVLVIFYFFLAGTLTQRPDL